MVQCKSYYITAMATAFSSRVKSGVWGMGPQAQAPCKVENPCQLGGGPTLGDGQGGGQHRSGWAVPSRTQGGGLTAEGNV